MLESKFVRHLAGILTIFSSLIITQINSILSHFFGPRRISILESLILY